MSDTTNMKSELAEISAEALVTVEGGDLGAFVDAGRPFGAARAARVGDAAGAGAGALGASASQSGVAASVAGMLGGAVYDAGAAIERANAQYGNNDVPVL
jgi:hypothetical protein